MSVTCKDMSDSLVYSGSQYSDQDRTRAAITYLTLGNLNKVSRVVNIPQRTLYDWVKTEWWNELITKIREEKHEEINAGFTRIIEKSMSTIEEKLENQEVSARDAAWIMGVTFDKRQVLNNQPTSISGKAIDINALQEKFNEFFNAKTIEGELLETD